MNVTTYKEKKLRFETLVQKLRYLRAELNEYNHKFDECKKVFSDEFTKSINKLKKKEQKNLANKQQKLHYYTDKPTDDDEIPKPIKALYRKIAFETHPDIQGHNKKRVKLFNKAEEAYSTKNWFDLIEIALSVGVSLPIPTKKQLKWLGMEEQRIKDEIDKIKNSVSWHWFHADNIDTKNNIMSQHISRALNQ